MKALSACLESHDYMRRFPEEEFNPECVNLRVEHLLKDHGLDCVAHSEIGHRRCTCPCDQVHLHTSDVSCYSSISSI